MRELDAINYNGVSIFVNRVKGQLPYGMMYYISVNGIKKTTERWFFSVSEAKKFVNDNQTEIFYSK